MEDESALTGDDEAIAKCLSLDESERAALDEQIERDAALARQLNEDAQLELDFNDAWDRMIKRAVRARDGAARELQSTFVPKPNPHIVDPESEKPPTASAVDFDHGRLLLRLDFYGLKEKTMVGDGNCQFRALSDQLFRDDGEHHEEVRAVVVEHLTKHSDDYAPYCAPLDINEYVRRMAQPGEWGDNITLQACADAYGVDINVLTSYMDAGFIEIQPSGGSQSSSSPRSLWISFFAEVHYNSILPGPTA